MYRKRSESSSSSTKSGHGHGGSNRRGVVLLSSSRAARNPLPGPPLLHHLPQSTMGDVLLRTFHWKELDRDLGLLCTLVILASRKGSERRRESGSLSPSKGNRNGQSKDEPPNRSLGWG